MASQPPEDPLLLDIIERALSPYKELLPAETLAAMRAEMADAMASYPYPAALLRKLRPPPVVQKSSTRPIDDRAASGPAEANGAAHHAEANGTAHPAAVLPFTLGRVRGGGR
jgi:hypothetical protein